jgi:GTP cyclohydrolase IA
MNKQLIDKANGNIPRSEKEIDKMIDEASKHYGKFLTALGFDYMADRQTVDTPKRVAKAWLKDLIVGSVSESPGMTIFPNDQGFKGIVIQTGIRVNSLCAHHNLPFTGWASVAYLPEENVIGLSKLNRVVEWFARRPQMQESLTQQVQDYLKEHLKCESIAVSISSKHTCCGTRGVKHPESVMTTNSFSGKFMEPNNLVREEFLQAIAKNGNSF